MSVFVFDTGLREQVDEVTIWHGHGWVAGNGEVRLPIDREHAIRINPDGETKVMVQ